MAQRPAASARTFFKQVVGYLIQREDFVLPLDDGPEAMALAVTTYIDTKLSALADAESFVTKSVRKDIANAFRNGVMMPDVVSSRRIASVIESGINLPDPSHFNLIKDGVPNE
jgi:hypothetical protein